MKILLLAALFAHLHRMPPPANDDCGSAAVVTGTGAFPFDTTSATTGAQGQSEAACAIQSSTAVLNDVWFTWSPPISGYVTIDTCTSAGTANATKLAIYDGAGCPGGAAIACASLNCLAGDIGSARISLFVATGQDYTIQVGNSVVPGSAPGTGTLRIGAIAPPPANDGCSAPATLVGIGSFPCDNRGGTTGAEGQGEGACLDSGYTSIRNDVWYTWNAPASGTVTVDLCSGTGTSNDSKMAVYDGVGCPTIAAIACNDDSCFRFSRVVFTVAAGNDYTFQIGNTGFPNDAEPGTNTLVIHPILPPPGNDDCSTPTILAGAGPFPFDNGGGTTGAEGQTEAPCNLGGYFGVSSDVWYTWTATVSGLVTVDLCAGGGTAVDTKLVVYGGAGCPGGAAIACNDDDCGPQLDRPRVSFTAVTGQDYTFQIGNSPRPSRPTQGTGTITITPVPIRPDCALDDGTTDFAHGPVSFQQGYLWMNRFGSPGDSTVITGIWVSYGDPNLPGESVLEGSPVKAGIWSDPDGGDPSNAVLLATAVSSTSHSDTDILNPITFSPPVAVSGIYLVGVGLFVDYGGGPSPASIDTSVPSAGRSWYVEHHGVFGEPPDFENLTANTIPPTDIDTRLHGGVWRLRPDCTPNGTIQTYCYGDASGAPCPCGNSGGSGRGCANSDPGSLGASLAGSGTASLSSDTLVLSDTGHHASSLAILWQGRTTIDPVIYGDGRRCVNGSLKRLFFFSPATADPLDAPGPISIPPAPATVSQRSEAKGDPLSSGSVRSYMLVYRDQSPSFCPGPPGSNFNVSNAVRVYWSL